MNTRGGVPPLYQVLGIDSFDINGYLSGWQNVGGNADGSHDLFESGC